MREDIRYINNKIEILSKFDINDESANIIKGFIEFLFKKTKIELPIIDHFFNSFVILINYDINNINVIRELLKVLNKVNKLLISELTEQLNSFTNYKYDDNYDSVVFETFEFLKYFYIENNLSAAINIIHEIIYNISRINQKLDSDVKSRLYIEILNDVLKNLKTKKSNKHIYLSTVETCNITVRLINEWLDKITI